MNCMDFGKIGLYMYYFEKFYLYLDRMTQRRKYMGSFEYCLHVLVTDRGTIDVTPKYLSFLYRCWC